jgi:hypothetical protein
LKKSSEEKVESVSTTVSVKSILTEEENETKNQKKVRNLCQLTSKMLIAIILSRGVLLRKQRNKKKGGSVLEGCVLRRMPGKNVHR